MGRAYLDTRTHNLVRISEDQRAELACGRRDRISRIRLRSA